MRNRLAVSLACVVLSACGGGGDDPPPPAPSGNVSVSNGTPLAIARLYVEPSPTTVFRTPRNDVPVAPGATFRVEGLAPGDWDVLASIDGSGTRFTALLMNLPLSAGETIAIPLAPADFGGRLELTNAGTTSITAIDVGFYPEFVLDAPLPAGQTQMVMLHLDPGTYDVTCTFEGGASSTGTYVVTALEVTPVTCP